MEFIEGKLNEEKVFEDLVFPKTLNPPIPNGTTELLVKMIKEKHEWLCDTLELHNAILFRGFNVSSPEEFRQVVEAFDWEEMPYMGPTNRVTVINRIYNASEAPLHQFINFHHEMFLTKEYPSKILFLCTQPSPEGGETCILPSHIVASKMKQKVPEFVSKLETDGFVFKIMTANVNSNAILGTTWKSYLNTEDEVEARKRSMEKLGCNSVEFNDDGSAVFVYGPLNPIREFEGKRVWFIPIVRHSANKKDTSTSFGDGTPLPSKGLEAYQSILDEVCVDIKWEKGDLMLLDNLTVQHGRRPAKPPRSVYVSLCK